MMLFSYNDDSPPSLALAIATFQGPPGLVNPPGGNTALTGAHRSPNSHFDHRIIDSNTAAEYLMDRYHEDNEFP